MPSPHRRVGLLLDHDMCSALAVLREHAEPSTPLAGLTRKAVFEGVALDAILRDAGTQSATQPLASQVLRDVRQLLETLALPVSVTESVLAEIDRASQRISVQERRHRQLALLDSPNPHGRAALDITESIDAFDRLSG